jgi:sulfate adenylyltransferase subunit 1 (EFTu-like GTPase family)
VSGLDGINLIPTDGTSEQDAVLREWYKGPSLLEMINTFKEPPRILNLPLRASVIAINSESSKGFEVPPSSLCSLPHRLLRSEPRYCKEDSEEGGVWGSPCCKESSTFGGLSKTMGPMLMRSLLESWPPSTWSIGRVPPSFSPSLLASHSALSVLRSNRSHEEIKLKEGMILFKGPQTPAISRIFKGTILTLSPLVPPIIPGSSFELYLHGEEVQCHIRKLYSVTSKAGTVKRPKCISENRSAVIRIEVDRLICIEEFSECRALGRFALRSKGKTYAVGVCDGIVPAAEFS